MVSIRRGIPADAARLAELATRTFRDAFAADNRPEDLELHLTRSYGAVQQAAELANPGIVSLIAEIEGVAVGYAQVRRGPAPLCVTGAEPSELWRFYVERAWHGRGVAPALMEAVVAAAAEQAARTLWLGVWERNERAQAFYRKCGFHDVGTQPFLLGTDPQTDRIMVRALEPDADRAQPAHPLVT